MDSNYEKLFDQAMDRYKSGANAVDLLEDFETITSLAPNLSAAWTCLSWLQLLCNKPAQALISARKAVKLNKQDPQARINLTLALLETKSKGVRDHVDFVKKVLISVPDLEEEISNCISDGLERKSDWESLKKVKSWLEI